MDNINITEQETQDVLDDLIQSEIEQNPIDETIIGLPDEVEEKKETKIKMQCHLTQYERDKRLFETPAMNGFHDRC